MQLLTMRYKTLLGFSPVVGEMLRKLIFAHVHSALGHSTTLHHMSEHSVVSYFVKARAYYIGLHARHAVARRRCCWPTLLLSVFVMLHACTLQESMLESQMHGIRLVLLRLSATRAVGRINYGQTS